MGQLVFVLIALGVTVYSAIDCLRTAEDDVRLMPKYVWLLVIILATPVGGVLWLVFGQSRDPGGHTFGGRGTTVTAPDDDPDFLRSLDEPRNDDQGRRE